jgi:hypothetical protein
MKRQLNEAINVAIMENEKEVYDWELSELANELYWWSDLFNIVFFRKHKVPVPVLTFEKSRVNNLGYFRIGINDFGVKNQINLNRIYLSRPRYDVLATLLHEMVHSFEHTYVEEEKRTKSWYHTQAFRDKIKELGIICDARGCHMSVGDPFVYLLKKHGILFDGLPDYKKGPDGFFILPPKPKPKGRSKLKKWSCGCTNVRVAIEHFEALCMKCGNMFEQVS